MHSNRWMSISFSTTLLVVGISVVAGCDMRGNAKVAKPSDSKPKPAAKPDDKSAPTTKEKDPNFDINKKREPDKKPVKRPVESEHRDPPRSVGIETTDFAPSDPDAPLGESRAMELLAAETAETAKLRPLLVVWFIDQSPSASGMAREVARMMPAFYQKIANSLPKDAAKDAQPRVVSAVVGFSDKTEFALKTATADIAAACQAAHVTGSSSTRECPFGAMLEAVKEYEPLHVKDRRSIVFIAVSDEAGDDLDKLDELAAAVAKNSIAVNVIGLPAAYGGAWSESRGSEFDSPEKPNSDNPGMMKAKVSAVRQGPETRHGQTINLAYFDGSNRAESLDTGYGPFGWELLCRKSGGSFLAIRARIEGSLSAAYGLSDRTSLRAMSKYPPDYVTEAGYEALLKENRARRALHEAAQLPATAVFIKDSVEFRPGDPARLKRQLDEAQREAAKLEPEVNRLYSALAAGQSDRAKLTGRRWQAAFDLAFGRVCAAKAKIDGYNTMLAMLKTGRKFTNANSTRWVLVPSDTTEAGTAVEKLLNQSKTMLKQVAKDHPGTPWAYVAQQELRQQVGWKWIER